jgi:hypothetical protein
MIEIILFIVLFSSLAGLVIIVYQKVDLIPETTDSLPDQFNLKNCLNQVKESLPFKDFSFESFLQKILSRTRVLLLKIENRISSLLQKLRQKSKAKKNLDQTDQDDSFLAKTWQDDNYWQKVKKFKKKKPLN